MATKESTAGGNIGERPRPTFSVYRRHGLIVRVLHWTLAGTLAVLLFSGLQIFNAHSELNWGRSSFTGDPPFFEITAEHGPGGRLRGVTRIGGHKFDTTGVLGVSKTRSHGLEERGFPEWMTIPSGRGVALGRRWHFFFAWVLVLAGFAYVLHAAVTERLRDEWLPTRTELRRIWPSVLDHLRLRRAKGEQARRYNVLQKLAYLAVVFLLLPGMVLMGLAMSPRLDALWPGWVDWIGGRQTARTLHFIGAWLIVLFVLVHVFQVAVTGLVNNLRSMITGNYRIESLSEAEVEPRRAEHAQVAVAMEREDPS